MVFTALVYTAHHVLFTLKELDEFVLQVTYSVPKWITFWREFPMVETTVPGAVFYNITLTGAVRTVAVPYSAVQTVAVSFSSTPGMENPWQAYTVRAEPLQCAALEDGQKQHYGIIR